MNNLKNSIIALLLYILAVFGLAQINFVEENIWNFTPAFFILLALLTVMGLFVPSYVSMGVYTYLALTGLIYGLVWLFLWTPQGVGVQILWIQFIFVLVAADLAFNVGLHLGKINSLLEGLSSNAYPNRALDIHAATDRISAELTRSRRYQHPLSLVLVEFEKGKGKDEGEAKRFAAIEKDLLWRFALARVSQIISDSARETDLILRDAQGRFILLCPETGRDHSLAFAERLQRAIHEKLGAGIIWSAASFPNEALTFEELLERAELRISNPDIQEESVPVLAREDSRVS